MPKADYTTWKYAYDINNIRTSSTERTGTNNAFTTISRDAAWLDKQNDKMFPLNLKAYQEEQKMVRTMMKQIDSVGKLQVPMTISTMSQDTVKYAEDKDKAERYKQWVDSRKTDIYLKETINVMDDMISLKGVVYKN
jgi:carboxyl-terminal processing protease